MELWGVDSLYSEENAKMEILCAAYINTLAQLKNKDRINIKDTDLKLDEMETKISNPAIRAFLKMQRLGKL